MQGPIGVPQRIGAVVVPASGDRMVLLIHAAIAPVDVAEQGRGQQAVIEAGVEDPGVGVGRAVDADRRQRRLPSLAGRSPDAVEVPAGSLGLEVGQRALDIDARQADLDHQRRIAGVGIVQDALQVLALRLARVGRQRLVGGIQLGALERARQLEREIDPAPRRPLEHLARADQSVVADQAQDGVLDASRRRFLPPVLLAMLQVDQQMARLALGEGVAVQADPLGDGQFGVDARVGQADLVVARRGVLAGAVIARAIAVVGLARLARRQQHRAGGRNHQDV